MIFYEVEDGSAGHYLVATQADAKREARERRCTWSQVYIPTDKAGLMAYINTERRVDRSMVEEQAETVQEQPETAQDQQDEVIEALPLKEHTGPLRYERNTPLPETRFQPQEHRLAERAAFLGTSEEVAVLTDRIGELDGWPLGQVALAAAARLKELAS